MKTNDTVSPVVIIRREAADAKIEVQKLRGNISVLMGSGGNIAVLTGRDGKVLVDAGITASRPRITDALASLSDDWGATDANCARARDAWHLNYTPQNRRVSGVIVLLR